MNNIKHLIISRTDSIGDVVLTLPMAGYLKTLYPDMRISFLGRAYTEQVVNLSEHVDAFLNWDNLKQENFSNRKQIFKKLKADCIIHVFPNREIAHLAKSCKIKTRVGTSHRYYHWNTCNVRPSFSRKNSELHESQLNFELLRPLIDTDLPKREEIYKYYGCTKLPHKNWLSKLVDTHRYNVILHPRSKGSAREWGLENFKQLIHILPEDRYQVFVTGTKDEAATMPEFLEEHKDRIRDMTGQLTLEELIVLIKLCDGIVAASTGPLHIASAIGKKAIGLYAPMRPIHPGRWEPLGEKASVLCEDKICSACRKSMDCECIRSIAPGAVLAALEN